MRSYLWSALGLVWLAAVALGLMGMTAYEAVPSRTAPSAPRWPAASSLSRDPATPTLLLFVHPHCPCTRATLAELQRVLAHPARRPRVYVLFVRPSGVPPRWEQTELWRTAASQPGVTVLPDDAGIEARRFGAVASGHVLLYDGQRELLFSGGITAARGHEGDNRGAAAVTAALASSAGEDPPAPTRTPVFGCALLTPGT